MKVYIIWQISISGWKKEIVEIFKEKQNALRFKDELQCVGQYYYELTEATTRD